jgi:hypothetical protein
MFLVAFAGLTTLDGLFPKNSFSSGSWYSSTWLFRKEITIDHTKVSNTDETNFSVLISITDPSLQAHAQSDGDDILFTDYTGMIKIPYEREEYISNTGTLVAWVNIPYLSATEDTIIYMYYGNPAASDQQNLLGGTWNSNFKGVWHSNDSSPTTIADSTSNANMGIKGGSEGPVEVDGKIGKAQYYNGNDDYIKITPTGTLSGSFTVSAWVKVSDDSTTHTIIGTRNGEDNSFDFKFDTNDDGDIIHGDIGDGNDWITTAANVNAPNLLNTWHQITYAITPSSYSIYIDGENVASDSCSIQDDPDCNYNPLLYDSSHNIFIGQVGYDDEWFSGAIDEVEISNIALSPDWIKTEYNDQNDPSTFYILGSQVVFDDIAPSIPGTPLLVSHTNNDEPTWSWAISTDQGSGLENPAYSVQWCNNSTYTDCEANISTSNTNSFTQLTPLANGLWYFRVLARDVFGNDSVYSSSASVLIDTKAPSTPGIPVVVMGSNLTSQEWSWAPSSDLGSGVSYYSWWIDHGPSGTTTNTMVTTNLTQGSWKFHVEAVDNAGNRSLWQTSLLAVLSPSTKKVVVDNSASLVLVVTPDSVVDPLIDLSPIVAPEGNLLVANINSKIILKTLLSSAAITVEIPDDVAIKGPISTWSGTIIPPVVVVPQTALLPAPPTGYDNQVSLAIVIGQQTTPLEITRGTRIYIEGQAGKKVGYISNNVFKEITDTCTEDSQAMGDALPDGTDCKIQDGTNLVIWTKHFSEFVTYTLVSSPQDNNQSNNTTNISSNNSSTTTTTSTDNSIPASTSNDSSSTNLPETETNNNNDGVKAVPQQIKSNIPTILILLPVLIILVIIIFIVIKLRKKHLKNSKAYSTEQRNMKKRTNG